MSAARPITPPVTHTPAPAKPASPEPAPPAALTEAGDTAVMELTSGDVRRLSSLLGYNIQSPAELIQRVTRLSTINVEGAEITLPEGLLQRMKSRALRAWGPEWIRATVKRLIANEVGY